MDQRFWYQCLAAQRSWLQIVRQFVLEGAGIGPSTQLALSPWQYCTANSRFVRQPESVCTFQDCQWRTEYCTDFTEAFATFQNLYCTVWRYTCTAFLATIFLKFTAQHQKVQLNSSTCSFLVPNFTQFLKWMWEVRKKSPLRNRVKRDF